MLAPFLRKLPADLKFAIEIRNIAWLDAALTDLLCEHRGVLVFQDLSSMPRPWEYQQKVDFVPAGFA